MKTKLQSIGIATMLIVLAILCADGIGIPTTLQSTKRQFQIIAPPTHPVKLLIVPARYGPTPDGYRIRWGGKSGVYTNSFDAGNMSPVSIPDLINGRQYFFAVEAYNFSGDVSGLSPETNAVITFKDVYEIVMTPLDSPSGTIPYGSYPQTSMLYTNSLPSVYVTYNLRVLPKP